VWHGNEEFDAAEATHHCRSNAAVVQSLWLIGGGEAVKTDCYFFSLFLAHHTIFP
jgi:hypothetical protein